MMPSPTTSENLRSRFEAKTERHGECLIWTGACDPDGYGLIRIARKVYRAHRVAYELYVGKIPKGMIVCHKCDRPPCVFDGHLWLGTDSDNVSDMDTKGRRGSLAGEARPTAKLTAAQVVELRTRYANGETLGALAAAYGIHYQTAYRNARGLRWASIQALKVKA